MTMGLRMSYVRLCNVQTYKYERLKILLEAVLASNAVI